MARIEVKNKTILVTGGANGIGRELVKNLSPYNTVYVLDRDEVKLKELQQEFPSITPLFSDLSDWDETRKVLEQGLPDVVHGLVNNAGIGSPGHFMACTENTLDRVLAVNTRAIVNVSQVVSQRIIDYNSKQSDEKDKIMGAIVNVSSLAARFPTRISLAYCVSKAAVDMFTKGMALELGSQNIRVNSVNPNVVMGTNLANEWIDAVGGQMKDKLVSRTPLGRVVDIKEVVNTIIFLLASEQVGMIHGENLLIDGDTLLCKSNINTICKLNVRTTN